MRLWGYWTKGKLDILRRYLDAFTTTTKNKSTEIIYIDAFAGDTENRDRLTGESIEGSARIALSVTDPSFTMLRFFETEANAPNLDALLRQDFPDRDLKVLGGDCNQLIPQELERLRNLRWAPTFAFVDPNGMEAEWKTLESLADFKKGQRWKAEILYYFAPPMFARVLPVDGQRISTNNANRIDRMYGTNIWRHIYQARVKGTLEPSKTREEYLNLMRWRLQNDLRYQWTHPIEVRNTQGAIIYYMIFATDHPAGDRIMRNIYEKAAAEFPMMREQARRIRKQQEDDEQGRQSLFGTDDEVLWDEIQPGERFYEYEPPTRPWFLNQSP